MLAIVLPGRVPHCNCNCKYSKSHLICLAPAFVTLELVNVVRNLAAANLRHMSYLPIICTFESEIKKIRIDCQSYCTEKELEGALAAWLSSTVPKRTQSRKDNEKRRRKKQRKIQEETHESTARGIMWH